MKMPGVEPAPETRLPLISLLSQFYDDTGLAAGDDVDLPDLLAALTDLFLMFMLYVNESQAEFEGAELGAVAMFARMFADYAKETEKVRDKGGFLEFLSRQAGKAYGGDDDS
jgi:hypothetical protein